MVSPYGRISGETPLMLDNRVKRSQPVQEKTGSAYTLSMRTEDSG
jgi:hypothetical protein